MTRFEHFGALFELSASSLLPNWMSKGRGERSVVALNAHCRCGDDAESVVREREGIGVLGGAARSAFQEMTDGLSLEGKWLQ